MEAPQKKKLNEFDQSIKEKKNKISAIESQIMTTSKKNKNPSYNAQSPQNKNNNKPITDSKIQNPQITDIDREQAKRMEEFLRSMSSLKDTLQDKSKYLQIQYQKQVVSFNLEKEKLTGKVTALQKKAEDKDKKIQKQIQLISQQKQQLRLLKEKVEKIEKTQKQTLKLNTQYKQENTKLKLENKSVFADNKILAKQCQKLSKAKSESQLKKQAKQFEQLQNRIMKSLYGQTLLDSKTEGELQKRYHHHDLSNKVKLDELLEQYNSYKKTSQKKIISLQKQLQQKDVQLENIQKYCRELKINKQTVQDLRIQQKKISQQRQRVLLKSQCMMQQIQSYNQYLQSQLKNKSQVPIIKQKIGTIMKIKKNYHH